MSRPGALDGLYWPELPGYPAQAYGPDALAMGPEVPVADAYYGYRYKVLPARGGDGYWILAWPARYGHTGIGSFVIDARGELREADLGPATAPRGHAPGHRCVVRNLEQHHAATHWRQMIFYDCCRCGGASVVAVPQPGCRMARTVGFTVF
ncbi:DUF2950 family protein [Achromobacter xylosoxidans]